MDSAAGTNAAAAVPAVEPIITSFKRNKPSDQELERIKEKLELQTNGSIRGTYQVSADGKHVILSGYKSGQPKVAIDIERAQLYTEEQPPLDARSILS